LKMSGLGFGFVTCAMLISLFTCSNIFLWLFSLFVVVDVYLFVLSKI
jgi:hypothetical protein